MQDLCVMMSASGSCRTTCARSLHVDLLCKVSLSECLHQDPVGPLAQDLYEDFLRNVFKIFSAESS